MLRVNLLVHLIRGWSCRDGVLRQGFTCHTQMTRIRWKCGRRFDDNEPTSTQRTNAISNLRIDFLKKEIALVYYKYYPFLHSG